MTVAVVIPNFNGAALLPACLGALAAQTMPADEIVVVDNGSTDDSIAVLGRYPDVRVLALPRNHGFAGGVNRGVAATTSDRVAVLNSDAEPAPDWLEVLAAAPAPEEVWAWGSVLVSPATGLVESAGDAYDAEGRAYKLAAGARLDDLPREPYEVFAPPGAAPLLRRDVFDRLGGYCEDFFLYYEDVDLAFRAQLLGYRALLVPAARVRHRLGASGGRPRTAYYVARNSLWCAVRNLPDADVRSLLRVTAREARWARQKQLLAPFVRGRLAGVAGLPRVWRERRAIQSTRRIAPERLAALFEPPSALASLESP